MYKYLLTALPRTQETNQRSSVTPCRSINQTINLAASNNLPIASEEVRGKGRDVRGSLTGGRQKR